MNTQNETARRINHASLVQKNGNESTAQDIAVNGEKAPTSEYLITEIKAEMAALRAQHNGFHPDEEEIVKRASEAVWERYKGLCKGKVPEGLIRGVENLREEASRAKQNKRARTKRPAKETDGLQGGVVLCPDVELWRESVNGAEVLNSVTETLTRYVALPDGAAHALALWCAHTHCFKCFEHTPRLCITSPERGCGKTTLRDVVTLFVNRALPLENLTTATALRLADKYSPTILADEYDGWLRENEELRSLLNSGHKRGGFLTRCEGENHEPRLFNAFTPAALFGIGALPGTLHDRSIVIKLARARPGEVRARFDSRRTGPERDLARKLARFCGDNQERLAAADPVLPQGVYNRVADNWRPLFAIAEAAGGHWARHCAEAYVKLTSREIDTESQNIELLADIRRLFTEKAVEGRVLACDLHSWLIELEARPWSEAMRGRPISPRWLGVRLASFGIHANNIRDGKKVMKGYDPEAFHEAFERYLPPLDACGSAVDDLSVHPLHTREKHVADGVADDVADEEGQNTRDVADSGYIAKAGLVADPLVKEAHYDALRAAGGEIVTSPDGEEAVGV
jgi:hypothetical protein